MPIGTSTIDAGPLDGRAFRNFGVRAEDDYADIVGLEVEGHALGAVVELDHLTGLDVVEAVDAGDSVADRKHGADFGNLRFGVEIRDLVADDAGNFSGADIHGYVLAFHRLGESVEFGSDRGVDLLASQLHDDSAKEGGIDGRVEGDVAASASTKLLTKRCQLFVVQRACSDDFSSHFAAMLGGEAAEGADDVAQLTLAAVAGENAEEARRHRIETELWSDRGKGFPGFVARNEGARHELIEILRIDQGLVQDLEALADGFDLPLVASEVEQGRRVTPC